MAAQSAVSHFTWMDYSERERRKALDVIDLFREQDTRDELGIGAVRDAFADGPSGAPWPVRAGRAIHPRSCHSPK